MVIISVAQNELTSDSGEKMWVVLVTVFNYSVSEGVVVPFAFDTLEDAEDAFAHFVKIAKLQGGDEIDVSTFSQN